MKTKLFAASTALLLALSAAAQGATPYNNKYYVPLNGPHKGASQWLQLDINAYPSGLITVGQTLTNDVFGSGVCASYWLKIADKANTVAVNVGPENRMCIGSKSVHEARFDAGVLTLQTTPEIAQRIMANPDIAADTGEVEQSFDLPGEIGIVITAAKLIAGAL